MREDRFIGADIVVDKYHAPINADYAMSVRDYVLRPQAYTVEQEDFAVTITLPPVVEARGKFYSIIAEDADNTNTITITHDGDSEVWPGDVVLNEKGRGQVFYSDGMKWSLQSFGDIHHSTALVAGQVNLRHVHLTSTGHMTGGGNIEVFHATLSSETRCGSWCNAIVGLINFGDAGHPSGMAASIVASMIPPNASLERGGLYALECNFNPGALSTWASAGPLAFMLFANWGTTGHFDDNAYFFRLENVYEEAGHMLSVNAHTLRVQIEGHVAGKERYLLMSEEENNILLTSTPTASETLHIVTTTATSALTDILLDSIFTIETGNHVGARLNVTWTPTTGVAPGGNALVTVFTADGIVSAASWVLGASCRLELSANFDNSAAVGGIWAALQAQLGCDAGADVSGNVGIACLHLHNASGLDMSLAGEVRTFLWFDNDFVGATGKMNSAMYVSCGTTTYFIEWPVVAHAMISEEAAAGHGGVVYHIRCKVAGNDVFLLASTVPA